MSWHDVCRRWPIGDRRAPAAGGGRRGDDGKKPERAEVAHAMARATWNGTVLAESDETIVVEGNHYFPPSAVNTAVMRPSSTHTTCSWKGVASYYTIEVDGQRNVDAAWFYPEPKSAAENITDYVAFWKGVTVDA